MRMLKGFVVALAASLPATPWVEQRVVVGDVQAQVVSYRSEVGSAIEHGVRVCLSAPKDTLGFKVNITLAMMDGSTQQASRGRRAHAGMACVEFAGSGPAMRVKQLAVTRQVEQQSVVLIQE